MDFASVDTKTVATIDGARQYDFLVVGNPCQHPEKLEEPLTDPIYGYFPHLKDSMPEDELLVTRSWPASLVDCNLKCRDRQIRRHGDRAVS